MLARAATVPSAAPCVPRAKATCWFLLRSLSSYAEAKVAKKDARRAKFESRVERLERQASRRGPRHVKKKEFRGWYDKRRTFHEIMDRRARQAGLEWKIRVAAIVQRHPVVLPDMPQWERDYIDLRAYLLSFGKEYPPELKLTSIDSPGYVPTDEEILGESIYPFLLLAAPRIP